VKAEELTRWLRDARDAAALLGADCVQSSIASDLSFSADPAINALPGHKGFRDVLSGNRRLVPTEDGAVVISSFRASTVLAWVDLAHKLMEESA
jgi:hypothetical protein